MKSKDQDRIWNDPKAFHHRVRMAAVQVAGLMPDELSAALAYEVEPFSGIPAAEAELVYRPVPDPDGSVRVFDVAVARRGRRKGASTKANVLTFLFGAIAVAALVYAWFDYRRIEKEEKTLVVETAERTKLDADIKALQGKINANVAASKGQRDSRAAIGRARQNTVVLRDAYTVMLTSLATAFADRSVVKEIRQTGNPYAAEIKAVSLGNKAASETFVRLSDALVPRGWRVEPGDISAETQDGTVSFSCTLTFDEGGKYR